MMTSLNILLFLDLILTQYKTTKFHTGLQTGNLQRGTESTHQTAMSDSEKPNCHSCSGISETHSVSNSRKNEFYQCELFIHIVPFGGNLKVLLLDVGPVG